MDGLRELQGSIAAETTQEPNPPLKDPDKLFGELPPPRDRTQEPGYYQEGGKKTKKRKYKKRKSKKQKYKKAKKRKSNRRRSRTRRRSN